MLEPNPYLDKLYFLEDKIDDLVKQLKEENYDYVIDLHSNIRSRMIKWRLGKKTLTYKKYSWQRWFLVKFKINKVPKTHIADWYMDTVKPLGIKPDNKGLDYFLPEEYEVSLTDFPEGFQNAYAAFIIGASEFTKKLPLHKMIELCEKINQPIILIGGKEDIREGENLKKHFDKTGKVPILNACGKYGISQSASIVKQAQLVFGHDTGLTHIAAAFQKKVYAIYGGTMSQYLHPYGTDYVLLENNELSCRPCAKAGRSSCPKGHFKCMNDLKFDFQLD